MGNIRRIKKQLASGRQQVAMFDTKTTFNNCRIFLAHPNPAVARKVAGQFAGFMNFTVGRARLVNIRDLYESHFRILEKIKAGGDLIEDTG